MFAATLLEERRVWSVNEKRSSLGKDLLSLNKISPWQAYMPVGRLLDHDNP
jgi:hypothetical protein